MSIWEIIAALFGFLCVAFYISRSMWSWPTGLVQVALYIVVFWRAKLYADMVLHIIYVVLQLYGWWEWAESQSRPNPFVDKSGNKEAERESVGNRDEITVQRMSSIEVFGTLVITGVLTILIACLLRIYTDGKSPEMDAFVSATSLVSQFLLARRYLENWISWIVVDTVAVGLFWSRGLYPTSVLYGIFWIMAWVGLYTWFNAARSQQPTRGES